MAGNGGLQTVCFQAAICKKADTSPITGIWPHSVIPVWNDSSRIPSFIQVHISSEIGQVLQTVTGPVR